ncbi:MAG: DUF1499 domain-containing protein [Caldilineaceae bacterium]|nr:DUF1499 domain-containing protein [Caldilineaceae bacterium]
MTVQKWWSLVLCFATFGMVGCSGSVPDNLGVENGRLAACPSSPNCVSTQAEDDEHKMEPLVYSSSVQDAQAQILAILEAMERMTVVRNEPGYIHAEGRSRIFRFVDDVEFYFDDSAKLIHFRSAARLGQGDGGVNRARMQSIADAFSQ